MFGSLFTYEGKIRTVNRVIYTDVVIVGDVSWNHGDGEIEAVLDTDNGILYFGEYDTETQVYNKSRNFEIKTCLYE